MLTNGSNIQNPPETLKLSDAYTDSDDWKQHPSKHCKACNVPLITRLLVVKVHDVIIVKLNVINTSNKMRSRININSVSSMTLKVFLN